MRIIIFFAMNISNECQDELKLLSAERINFPFRYVYIRQHSSVNELNESWIGFNITEVIARF